MDIINEFLENNIEKTRAPYGEKFWYVKFYNWSLTVDWMYECKANEMWAEECFKRGNYFHTEAEAWEMVEKLNAVFKGADVIEMPSEEEIREYTDNYTRYPITSRKAIDWLGTKIVK